MTVTQTNMIHFYNKNREVVMILRDFTFEIVGEPRITFFADISYTIYKASKKIDDFKIWFDKFLKELKLLYDWKTKTAQFVPLERQLEIYFKQLEYGHILVTIILRHEVLDESMLLVQYEIDQSFLPELINEFNTVLG